MLSPVKAKPVTFGPKKDLREWIQAYQVYFERNPWLWKDAQDRIHCVVALYEGKVKD